MRGYGRAAAVAGLGAAIAACWLMAGSTPAFAHALVRSSDPASGAVLATAPRQVLITFTEPPDPKLSSVQLLDPTGRVVSKQPAQTVPGNPRQLRLPLPPLGKGVYTVAWRTLSESDGHVTAGSFAFGVGVPATTAAGSGVTQTSNAPVRPLGVAGTWALAWGLVLLFGAGVIGSWVTHRFAHGHRALLVAAWALAAAGLLGVAVSEWHAVGVSLGALLSSASGQDLVTQAFALLAPLVMVIVALIRPRSESMAFLAVASAAAMLAVALTGHAAGESPEWLNVGVQWIHLMAVGAWVGGLAWLLLAIRGADSEERRAAVRRFSTLAGIALAITLATGIGRAWAELGGWRQLFDTSFGITLLVKSALVVALIALGALNRYRNVPRMETANPGLSRVRRTVRWEVGFAIAIVAVTAVLSQLPPGAYEAEAKPGKAAPTGTTVVGSDFGTTTKVRLTVTPGTVGPNAFRARLTDFDTGAPVTATRVSLAFVLPSRPSLGTSTLELKRAAPGMWGAQGSQLSIEGTWDVTVVVQREAGAVEVPLKVRTRLPPEQIQVSKVPGQPTLYTITLPGGATMQGYVDPATPGPNQVHFTFFTASGSELPISHATASATDPAGDEGPLRLIRFSAGHFVANAPLTTGRWTFRIDATERDGGSVTAYYSQHIG
jgi:copper transport protein